jgi:hypothetical protein
MTPTIRRYKKWNRWTGSPSDLAAAATIAQKSLTQLIGTDPECRISVDRPGRLTQGVNIEQLASLPQDQIPQVSSVDIRFGGFSAPYAHLELSKQAPALSLQVEGGDETQVEGTFSQMVTELDRGSRKPEWVSSTTLYFVVGVCFSVGIIALPAALLNLTFHLHWIRHRASGAQMSEIAMTAVGVLLIAMTCIGTYWLFPDLELLPQGTRTRWTRFRAVALTTLSGILIGLTVSVLTALASS